MVYIKYKISVVEFEIKMLKHNDYVSDKCY